MIPDLYTLSRQGDGPFTLQLAGVAEVECLDIVRRIPDKRLVCRGYWNGRAIYAKFFIGTKAARYAARDARGSNALAMHGIPTPQLLHQGEIGGISGRVLLYAEVAHARNCETIWLGLDHRGRVELAERLVDTVALHHSVGLLQTDLYLRNFLFADDTLYTLDGDGIRLRPSALPWPQSLGNLALLLSKFDVEDDAQIPKLLARYALRRDWVVADGMLAELQDEVLRLRLLIARGYARKKVLRDCSDVRVDQRFERFQAIYRPLHSDTLDRILENPDAWLDHKDCLRLKNGNTCTVGLVEAEGRKIVIKRYNIKNFRHGLGRLLRPTRANLSWSNAHLLRILGIATAAPLALLERRWGPLRREGYFMAEFVDGPDIAQALAAADPAGRNTLAEDIARLLYKLYRLGIEHGDCKATNIKIVNGKPLLLDLDAMRLHRRSKWFDQRHVRDLKRFLKNWQDDPAILQLIKNAIGTVYGDTPIIDMI